MIATYSSTRIVHEDDLSKAYITETFELLFKNLLSLYSTILRPSFELLKVSY